MLYFASMKQRCSTVVLLFAMLLSLLVTEAQQTITPVIPGDFADPSVIRVGKSYYAVGTSSEWAPHFPIYKSADLENWTGVGYVFDRAPEWTMGSFWAPEYYHMNGQYYIYYTARRKSDKVSCIGVAVSKYPDRDFVDKGIIVEHGKEAIDAFIVEADGQRYMTYKAYGLDQRPIEILAKKLSADGLQVEGEAFSLFKDSARVGLEGQSFVQKDGYFYFFYSAGACCGLKCDYNVRVARSKTFRGPYEVYNANPILSEYANWKCAGHGTFVKGAVKNQYYYLYHAYNQQTDVFTGRQGQLATLDWPAGADWPKLTPVVHQGANQASIIDRFTGITPANHWQWDWRHSTPSIRVTNNRLQLGGTVTEDNTTGIVLTVRPTSVPFELSVQVNEQSSALAGLAYYGDANAALGLGIADGKLQVWTNKGGNFQVHHSVAVTGTGPVQLRISLDDTNRCRFYYMHGSAWKELTVDEPIIAAFLPQWDRSPRPGLHIKGDAAQTASFSNFRLSYN